MCKYVFLCILIALVAVGQDRLQFAMSGIGGSETFAPNTQTGCDPLVEYGTAIVSADVLYSFGKLSAKIGLDVTNTDSYEQAEIISCHAEDLGLGCHAQLEWHVSEGFVPFLGVSFADNIDVEYRNIVGYYRQYEIVENVSAEAKPGIGGYLGAYVWNSGPWRLFVSVLTREWRVEFEDMTDRCQSIGYYVGTEYRF